MREGAVLCLRDISLNAGIMILRKAGILSLPDCAAGGFSLEEILWKKYVYGNTPLHFPAASATIDALRAIATKGGRAMCWN